MPEKHAKIRRYRGRIETIAARDRIAEMVHAGYSHAMIYDELWDHGAVSVSYRQFCRCVRQMMGTGQKAALAASKLRTLNVKVPSVQAKTEERKEFGRRLRELDADDVC